MQDESWKENLEGEQPVRRKRLPEWLKKKVPVGAGEPVRNLLEDLNLNTVCKSARCPNCFECYNKMRATFLIMGPSCSRNCRFCAVDSRPPAALDADEPARVGEAVRRLNLKHAVITSVTRDDLPDGGAEHFAKTIEAVRKAHDCTVEVLTPDFQGNEDAIRTVCEVGPDIFNHNVETAPRLYSQIRPQADYVQSLEVLRFVGENYSCLTKSGIMVGLGETFEEIMRTCEDLSSVGVRILTVGQYLSPSERHAPVVEYIHPDMFDEIGRRARELGFLNVASAPFVRSSYNAEEVFAAARE